MPALNFLKRKNLNLNKRMRKSYGEERATFRKERRLGEDCRVSQGRSPVIFYCLYPERRTDPKFLL
jgi:hypothetical protein